MKVSNEVRYIFLNRFGGFLYRLVISLLADNILDSRLTASTTAVGNGVDDFFDEPFF